MITYITWPEDFGADIFGIMGNLVGDFTVPLGIIMAVLVFAIIIKVLIGTLHK